MPEEINRVVTDSISDYFFTTTEIASANLINSGICHKKIFFVGNTMIDTLKRKMKNFTAPQFFYRMRLKSKNYFVLTLHRPSNVDDLGKFSELIKIVCDLAKDQKIIFPAHPRVRKQVEEICEIPDNLIVLEPLPYLEFNWIVQNSA